MRLSKSVKVVLLSMATLAGLSAGTAVPKAMAADSALKQRALAELHECEPLKVFFPAAGFKPLTASAAQLRSAGYPPRPPESDELALRAWTNAVNRPLHFTAPHPVCSATKHAVVYTGTWAGHQVPASYYGSLVYYTQSSWVQPAVAGNSNYTNYQTAPDASFWTGTGVDDIIQAGCDSISTSTPQYKCWTENFPYQGSVWEGPVVRPGQTVFVFEEYEGSNEAYYYIENETTGETQSFTNSAPDHGLGSAEYINEKLGPYLPNFGTVRMSGNYFGLENGSSYYISSSKNNAYIMVDSGGNVMSQPSSLFGGCCDFDQIFYRSS